ncbi:MAG: M1 family metallopeptidase [Thaumarchaeota archaeon]|nr:M1 family metallopeptidase [Nitrososphaerota archaeon]
MPSYKTFILPESSPHYPPSKDFHTEHIRIELKVDFAKRGISGTCTLRIRPVREGLSRVVLDACGLDVKSVAVDGNACEFEVDGRKMVVLPGKGLSGTHSVSVEYSAVPGEGVYFTGPDEEHPEKEVQAWSHNETELARYWFPCRDFPDDKSSSEMLITVPMGFKVISNGVLVSATEDSDWTTFHWKEDIPHPTYLKSFVAGRFGEIKQESEGVPLHYYFPESKRQDALRYFGETPQMIKVFQEVTGVKYPYKKYAQTTVEDFIYGGMENFNATTLATNYYPDSGSEADFQTTYSTPHVNPVNLVAHELAHQWFGDLVTCSDWSHAFLNEGFATYLQGLYLERTRGADEFRWDMAMRAEQYFDEDKKSYRRPIVEKRYCEPDDVFDYTTYEKGEWMLHELRYLVGDPAFFDGVKGYLATHSFGNADTHDFRKAMEKASGRSLEEFFEQSFMKPGFPEFEVGYAWDPDSKSAAVTVKQIQNLDMDTPRFKLPCDIVFYSEGRRMKKRVMVTGTEQTFSFELPSRPTIVEFDPEQWLLKKVTFGKGVDLLVNQLSLSQDAASRSEAARTLGETKIQSVIGPLKEAARRKQFWDVNAAALKALGEIGTDGALKALLEVGLPENRRARRALAEALGHFKTEQARSLLVEMLASDESPYVRCEAALALAKAWPEGAFAHLKGAMKSSTPNEVLAEACLEAMGKLGDKEIPSMIIESTRYGKPTRVRIGAMRAIKARGRILDEEVPVLQGMLLKDKELRVRLYVVAGLIPEVQDKRMLAAVTEASKKDRDPRVRRRALEAFYELSAASETSATLSRLREEVEKLKEQNDRLSRQAG